MSAPKENPNNKKTEGRRSIPIEPINDKEGRQVTFSKRRYGVCKKASELITLSGAELVFVAYSEGGKPFGFVHPSFEDVANRFLGIARPELDVVQSLLKDHKQVKIDDLNREYDKCEDYVENLKKNVENMQKKCEELPKEFEDQEDWWNTNIDEANVDRLRQIEELLKQVHEACNNNIAKRFGAEFIPTDFDRSPRIFGRCPLLPPPYPQDSRSFNCTTNACAVPLIGGYQFSFPRDIGVGDVPPYGFDFDHQKPPSSYFLGGASSSTQSRFHVGGYFCAADQGQSSNSPASYDPNTQGLIGSSPLPFSGQQSDYAYNYLENQGSSQPLPNSGEASLKYELDARDYSSSNDDDDDDEANYY